MPILSEVKAVSIIPLVKSLAKRNFRFSKVVSLADLEAEGLLALTRASHRFKAKRNVKLSTFAYRAIDGAMKDAQEKQFNHDKRVIVAEMSTLEELDSVSVDPRYEDGLAQAQLYGLMIGLLEEHLPEEQALIIIRIYFEGVREKQVARELAIPRSHVDFFHQRALVRLRKAITTV